MNKKEYEEQRATLMAKARSLLTDGKSLEAKAQMDQVNVLDGEFVAMAIESANTAALEGGKVPVKLENLDTQVKGAVVAQMNDHETKLYNAASPEYRTAFFNTLRGAELTQNERSAYEAVAGISLQNAYTTTTEASVIPTKTLNEIWDLCKEQHSILQDIDMRITGVVIRIPKRTAITAGKGKNVAENTSNEDMADNKVHVELSGKDFAATVELSYAAAKMSIDALEAFLARDVAEQVGDAMAADVVTTIQNALAADNDISSKTAQGITYEEICKLFGLLKRCKSMVAYVSNATLYNHLVAMVDASGRPIFQTNMQEGAKGALLGATIKLEDSVADGKILVGDPKRVICNVVEDIMVETDRDIKRHMVVYSAYARAQAALMDDKSFAQLTIASA